ncbi:MAG: hypothetical protein B0W54_03665 [Cellvibrio sp. 79]|nr:MAG: hypothetical protein B0W54_03665 [Cellvibrio sp. 79]
MNSGNLLNTLLGATSNIAVPNKNTAAKNRAETNEQFRNALEQARPNVAAPKARKPEADSARAEISRTREDARESREPAVKEPAARTKATSRQAEKPASAAKVETTRKVDTTREAGVEDDSKPVKANEVANIGMDEDTETSLSVDDASSEVIIDANPNLVNQLLQQTPESNIDALPLGAAEGDEAGAEVESITAQVGEVITPLLAAGETAPTSAIESQGGLIVESPLVDANADTETVSSLTPGQLTGINPSASTVQGATNAPQSNGAASANSFNGAVDQLAAESVITGDAPVIAEGDSSEIDAAENPDFFTLLNAKAGITKPAESPLAADKIIQVDAAKPPATPSPLVEPLARLTEAQSPAARSFVAQTGVPVPVGQPQWSQAVGEKVLWLAAQNVSAAEIRLDPPDMGQLHVKVSVNQDQASVTFISPHPVVREALDQQLNRLREMFSDQGLNLVNVDVSDRSGAQQQQDQERNGHAGSSTNVEEEELIPVGATAITNLRLVDHYA